MTPYYYECRHCHQPAFDLTERPAAGTPCKSANARHLDGAPIVANSPMLCDNCGRQCGEPVSRFFGLLPLGGALLTNRIKARP
jgi:hypothetical protein